jgi:pimeloyl-ACP methyl ester carboxylesterase
MLRFFKALGRRPRALLGIFALAAVLGALFLFLDKAAERNLGFYVWRYASGQAHGGECLETNGACIHYETFGAGPPVLVLDGGLASMESMRYQIQALSGSHLVIAADSRGHGRSTDSDAPLSYSLMAGDMLALLDRLKIQRADVVGWSDGRVVGLELAMHHPERVNRLVVIGAEYDPQGINVALPDPDGNARRALRSAIGCSRRTRRIGRPCSAKS